MLNDLPSDSKQTDQRGADEPWAPVAQHEQPEASGSIGSTVRELLETVLFILLIFFIVRGLIQNFRIDGSSMAPNLHNDQYILVNKVLYFHFDSNAPLRLLPGKHSLPAHMVYPIRMPKRGDVVVLEAPPADNYDGTTKDYIKRVIGLPGETVLVRDGRVFIDGQAIDEPYLEPNQRTDCGTHLCEPYTVPPDSVVVMGDNRGNSQDSRSWNADPGLPLEHVVGKAWVSYWPQSEWGVIPSPTYASDRR
jgi:signal peptidase I